MKSSMTLTGGTKSFSHPQSLLEQEDPSSLGERALTPLQTEVDGLVGGFVQQATDWKSLVAVMAGGMAYRWGRMGVMSGGAQNFACAHMGVPLQRVVSIGIGLGAEVTAFETTHRALQPETPNTWRWEGPRGIREGLLTSLITFGALKGVGRLAQGENLLVQHLLQDSAVVLGHRVSGILGIAPHPTGSLAEQFLHAEAMNLQLNGGMALVHHSVPSLLAIERGLDLSLRSVQAISEPFFRQPALAASASFTEPISFSHQVRPSRGFLGSTIAMSSLDDGEGVSSSPSVPPPPTRVPRTIPPSAPTGRSREFPYELRIEDFSNFLTTGHRSVIAVREGREFWVELGHREKTKAYDRYFPAGTPKFHFRLKEGNTLGKAVIYLEPDAINLYSIVTKNRKFVRTMSPGAGTIFLDWLATQAALQGKDFNIIRVEEPRIFHILSRNQLVEPESTTIEACLWTKGGYRVHTVDAWGSRELIDLYEDGRFPFLNIRARPNRSLIPPSPSESSN